MEWTPIVMVKTIPNRILLYFLVSTLVCTACLDTNQPKQVDRTCNGLTELCDRPLDEVLFAGTHNAMSSTEDGWNFPNQEFAFTRQLEDGIRGLNFDTYLWNDEAYLCHTFCELGSMTLVEGGTRIANFLMDHPNEVIVITLQSALEKEPTLQAFEQSGLRDMLHHHEVGDEWSTLGELIDLNERVVLFSNSGAGEDAGYLDQWTHWIDNPYSAQSNDDFSCSEDRGDPETASLFNVNHFITHPVADIEDSLNANRYDILWEHLERCQNETGRIPNQLLVDFYSQGDVLEVVLDWNQQSIYNLE